ncbi:hypothetical protein CUD01_19140 [Cellulomonas uda]|uniref:Uncharacterized protein n=1 Tax=Cellulomonas uda TaxID=1714 RepID=A0A4Y3KEX6_CELUD|nr:hypothetical protein CUD01_19140 [Cellulomonas uda]
MPVSRATGMPRSVITTSCPARAVSIHCLSSARNALTATSTAARYRLPPPRPTPSTRDPALPPAHVPHSRSNNGLDEKRSADPALPPAHVPHSRSNDGLDQGGS